MRFDFSNSQYLSPSSFVDDDPADASVLDFFAGVRYKIKIKTKNNQRSAQRQQNNKMLLILTSSGPESLSVDDDEAFFFCTTFGMLIFSSIESTLNERYFVRLWMWTDSCRNFRVLYAKNKKSYIRLHKFSASKKNCFSIGNL